MSISKEKDLTSVLQRALARERQARKAAEQILEQKSSELYELTQIINKSKDELQVLVDEKDSELSGLIQRIIDPYLLLDLNGNILKYNAASDNLLKLKNATSSITQLNLIEFIAIEDRERLSGAFVEMLEKGFVKDVDVSFNDEDGNKMYFQMNAAILYDAESNPKAAQGIARDVTKLKVLEHQKDKLLNELVDRNEELNEYAHVVSHDLKSPLNGINALIKWIKKDNKDAFDDKALEMFDLIEKSIIKMDSLITGILKYSKLDAELEPKNSVDVKLLIEEIYLRISPKKSIKLEFETDMPLLFISRNKIEQVILNLMSNAIKFTTKETGKIIWRCLDLDDKYQFSITDNGIGIEEKYFDKIFKIFQYLEAREDSTGIGLAIVKKVIHSLGGDIWLESVCGEGSTFFFTLPKSN